MKVLFINNDGGGFHEQREVPEGTNISQFLGHIAGLRSPQDYHIRVNRESVDSSYVLQEGDRVSITPTKVTGAR